MTHPYIWEIRSTRKNTFEFIVTLQWALHSIIKLYQDDSQLRKNSRALLQSLGVESERGKAWQRDYRFEISKHSSKFKQKGEGQLQPRWRHRGSIHTTPTNNYYYYSKPVQLDGSHTEGDTQFLMSAMKTCSSSTQDLVAPFRCVASLSNTVLSRSVEYRSLSSVCFPPSVGKAIL
jgi:hypothetical protein